MKILNPPNWPSPKGYSNGIEAQGRLIFVSGQIGWDESEKLVGPDLVSQTEQALKNICTVLAQSGAGPQHITRLTWYVTDKRSYIAVRKEIGQAYRRVMGSHYPAMSLLEVKGLLEDGALVEIEASAVVS